MSKQVELKDESLIVRTREDYKQARKVIVTRKGETAKAFYPYYPQFINNLDDVKDWQICGYKVEDLVKLALILKDKSVDDYDLRNYNACFFDGYKRAVEDNERAIKETIDRMFADIKKEDQ